MITPPPGFTVKLRPRFICDTCGKGYATRSGARGHSPCYQSPEAKGCATCKHLVPGLRGGYMEGPDRPARCRLYGEDLDPYRRDCDGWQLRRLIEE